MAVLEVYEALGSFDLELNGNVPREILDEIDYFGHIAIVPGRMNPVEYGDGTLSAARYVGVVRKKRVADDGRTNLIQDDTFISGVGMDFWLGDEDGKGAVIEEEIEFTEESFTTVIATLQPDSVSNGTVVAASGTYSGRHQYQTPREAIKYVCDTMSGSGEHITFRVTNDGKLDVGPESDLYVTEPTCIIVRKGSSVGEDLFMRAIPGNVDHDADMEDFSTRVVMLAESNGESLATGSADIDDIAPGVNVYKDLQGNPLKLTRMVSESETLEELADVRAEINLRNVLPVRRALTLATEEYDIFGSFTAGDYVWVYDPDAGLIDTDNEVFIRGMNLNPVKLQVTETDWPITEAYSVGYRNADGEWFDLTDYVKWEEEQPSKITIGAFNRVLNESIESVGLRTSTLTAPDSSTPDAPEWVTAAFETVPYLAGNGYPKAAVNLVWTTPLNTNGTAVSDGDRYEIQFKLSTGHLYSQSWGSVSNFTWAAVSGNTWEQPVEPGDPAWETRFVQWGTNILSIQELAVDAPYDIRVRAIDKGNNTSDWSTTETVVTAKDNIPPSTPAAPQVASSLIAVQIMHELGKASGGTFNLENDLAYLEVHGKTDPFFSPSADSCLGTVPANINNLAAETAIVATFNVQDTTDIYVKVVAVDTSGNRSPASAAASASAMLIDDAHISDLTVSKVTAGTISSDWIVGASIKTAETGSRVELNSGGIELWNDEGIQTVDMDADTGDVSILGQLASGTTGTRVVVNPTGTPKPAIRFYPHDDEGGFALIEVWDKLSVPGADAGIVMSTAVDTSVHAGGVQSMVMMDPELTAVGRFGYNSVTDTYPTQGGSFVASDTSASMRYSDYYGGTNAHGYVVVNETSAEMGYLNSADSTQSQWLYMQDGYTYNHGTFVADNIATGTVSIITDGSGSATSVTVSGLDVKGNTLRMFMTPNVGSGLANYKNCGFTGLSNSGFTAWCVRSNTTVSEMHWLIIGKP